MELPTFLRLFQLRKSQVMWLLGAGTSRTAGIKTAGDMIWEFKQRLYCSEKRVPHSFITDVGDPSVRQKMQAHFDAQGSFPAPGAEDEYSAYFEATYPSAKDRRIYIEEQVKHGKPSYGHFALALLMREGLCHAIWTSNFDHTLEDAAFKILGSSGKLVVADLGEPRKLRQAWTESRWPIYSKLHGDYHSDNLKNISTELRNQDAEIRRTLVDACRNRGLAIVGYSGRDASVMEALEEAIDQGNGYPGGLFWFKRPIETPYAGVTRLIERAREAGVDAHFVEVESFDELFSDVVRFLPETEKAARSIIDVARPRLTKAAFRAARTTTPAIRTNGLPITSYPAACRLVVCDIGGWEEIQAAIQKAGADIIAQRCSAGVLAFGRDTEVKRTFEPHNITRFDTHAITPNRLAKQTGERSLIRDALFQSLGHRPGLRSERRGTSALLLPDAAVIQPSIFNTADAKAVDRIAGTVGATGIAWTEACSIKIDYKLERLWLLIEPLIRRTIPEGTAAADVDLSREFVRERQARRRNKAANAMLDGWARLIAGNDTTIRMRLFDISDGYDGDFEIMRVTGFSGTAS
jgi:hypothetical protein